MPKQRTEEFIQMLKFVSEWVKTRFKPFTIHDALKAYYDSGANPLENKSTAGSVAHSLQSSGNIFPTEKLIKVKRADKKSRLVQEFISKEYRQRQQENRLSPYKQQQQLFE